MNRRSKLWTAPKENISKRSRTRNTLYEVERYQTIIADLAATEASTTTLSEQLEAIKSNLERLRDSASETIRHLSWLFGDVLGELIPGEIDGEVKLDGRGLSLKVEYGGNVRRPPSIHLRSSRLTLRL